jgi:hypothetical protein
MKIRKNKNTQQVELPLQFSVSFEKPFTIIEGYASEDSKDHPFHNSAKILVNEIKKTPELLTGINEISLLENYKDQIEMILHPLFPDSLMNNEIKAASIPFSFTSFMFTTRFEEILKDAGDDFDMMPRNLENDLFYIHACAMIMGMCHGYVIGLRRPFFFDIPDKNGDIKNYRVAFNADMAEIIPTENAPEITEEDYHLLLDNFENVELWREKFPPNSYIFKGFGIMNLFDVTTDEIISDIRTTLLRSDDGLLLDLQKNLSRFFNIKDLMLGFSLFELTDNHKNIAKIKKSDSLALDIGLENDFGDFFCSGIVEKIFNKRESLTISNVEKYGELTAQNGFYKRLKAKGIGSIILIPIKANSDNDIAVLEIASPRPFELNSINQNKLKDILPVFELAVERATKEQQNILEATIQEHYTSIHPSVKWRFSEAAEKYHNDLQNKVENVKLDEIVFEEVYPLYGQSDIKGSSVARNEAIQEDLTTQLELAIGVLNEANKNEELPIYDELMFRVNSFLTTVKFGLKAGDEVGILDFFKRDIYPVFNHIKELSKSSETLIDTYLLRLDPELKVVYEKRKAYEKSVTFLNDKMANFLDAKEAEAQGMFPHYFERYKTDGVEYNMYIGNSLVKNGGFNDLYLYNLRLWQLQTMYEVENIAFLARKEMEFDLEVASLILVHSNPLAIKFRMDEKQFDVDGAYNIRYEIIKKRIDKAHINGTKERLTVPGKIAIVYSQDKDAVEYMKYIKYLQSKNYLGKVEKLELEDLQSVSGLKALRVEVIYQNNYDENEAITIDKLIKEIQI